MKAIDKGVGHRKRLREKFLKAGFIGFHDYEIVELLLTVGTPRRDCKEVAKELIKKFGNVSGVIDALEKELIEIKGVGNSNLFGLKLVKEAIKIYDKEQLEQRVNLNSPEEIYKYLRDEIGSLEQENFVVLFFNTKNELVVDVVSRGTLNASIVHPREVFKNAIRSNASHIVIAHNHPSGDTLPSDEDIRVTNKLIDAGKILGINVIDHLVVSKNGYTSFHHDNVVNFNL